MNTPAPFSRRTCPNREWHPQVERRCPMCGLSGPAYRLGERLAPILLALTLAAAIVVPVLLAVR